jgi:predicted  nucleic acid-binding Zn-ribbon protein
MEVWMMYMKKDTFTSGISDDRSSHRHSQIKELGRMESELRTLNKQFISLRNSPSEQQHVETKMDSTIDAYRKLVNEVEKEEKEINDDGSSHDTIDDDLTHLKAVKEEIKQKENVKIKSKETESELLGLWVEETNLEKKIMNTKSKRPRTEHEIKELEANRKKLIGEANTSLHLVSSHDTEE